MEVAIQKKKKNVLWMVATAISILLFIATLAGCGASQSQVSPLAVSGWQEQYDLGMRYLQEGNYEEAIIAFTQAISIDAKQPSVYLARAQAYETLGTSPEYHEKAKADYEKAQELGSTEEEVWIGLSNARLREGDLFGAADCLRQGLEALGGLEQLQERIDSLLSADSVFQFPGGRLRVSTWSTGNTGCSIRHIEDSNNRPLSAVVFSAVGETMGTILVERDENGNHTKGGYVMEIAGEHSVFSVEREFDSEDRLITESIFSPDGEKQSSTKYSYDEAGMCVRVEEYDGQDTLLQYCDFVKYIDPADEEASGNMGVIRYEGQASAEPVSLKGTMYIVPESKSLLSFQWSAVDYQFRDKYELTRQFEYAQEGERMVYVGYNIMGASVAAAGGPQILTIA